MPPPRPRPPRCVAVACWIAIVRLTAQWRLACRRKARRCMSCPLVRHRRQSASLRCRCLCADGRLQWSTASPSSDATMRPSSPCTCSCLERVARYLRRPLVERAHNRLLIVRGYRWNPCVRSCVRMNAPSFSMCCNSTSARISSVHRSRRTFFSSEASCSTTPRPRPRSMPRLPSAT